MGGTATSLIIGERENLVYLLGYDWWLKQEGGRDCAVLIKFNSDDFLMLYMCESEDTPVIKHLFNSSRLSLYRL